MKRLRYTVAAMVLLQASSVFSAAVQVGTFSVSSNANKMVQRLGNMGYQAVSVSQGGLNVVRIENLSSLRANNACSKLESSGIECFVSSGSYSSSKNRHYSGASATPSLRRENRVLDPIYNPGSDFSL